MGLMEANAVVRHRKRKDSDLHNRRATFSYFITKNGQRVPVCRQAFLSLHSVTSSRVARLNTLLLEGKSPKDLRGKHSNRPHALASENLAKIKEHIESFPYKTSHYSSKNMHYLNANLTVKTMHSLFLKKHPDLETMVKYEYYVKYFNENYCFKFGRPQVDVCSECERLKTKLLDQQLNNNAKRVIAAELIVHKRRAKKYYTKLQEIKKKCEEEPEVMGITFDFMQNLPLPNIPVQEIFYYRQLWVYAFQIHNLKDGSGHFYTYHEGQALKGPNEVCTFLKDYVENKIPPEITELFVFSDGCPGQNRNNTVVRFFLALAATKRFKIIHQYFPLRGHSFLPCDRDFGSVKRLIRRSDRIYLPEEYQQMIKESRKKLPFTVNSVSYNDIIDFKSWWPNFFKKSSKSIDPKSRDTFAVSQYKQFSYSCDTPGYVTVYEFIGGLRSQIFKLVKPNVDPILPNTLVYSEPVPINNKKIVDIKNILQYIPPGETLGFYYHIVSWKTCNKEDAA